MNSRLVFAVVLTAVVLSLSGVNSTMAASVKKAPMLSVLSPNGSEQLIAGRVYRISWASSGVKTVDVYLMGFDQSGKAYNTTLAKRAYAGFGGYNWKVSNAFAVLNQSNFKQGYRIMLKDSNSDLKDTSFRTFSVIAPK